MCPQSKISEIALAHKKFRDKGYLLEGTQEDQCVFGLSSSCVDVLHHPDNDVNLDIFGETKYNFLLATASLTARITESLPSLCPKN